MIRTRTRQPNRRRIDVLLFRTLIFLLVSSIAFNTYLHQSISIDGLDARSFAKHSFQRKEGCYSYGCKMHPPELTEDIRKDIEEIKQANGRQVSLAYGNSDMAGLTQQGKDHTENQDRGIIVSPFYTSNQNVQFEYGSMNDFLIGIFDGHGDLGHEVSQYLQDHFPKRLSEKLSHFSTWNDNVIKNALNETLLEIDKELPGDTGMDGGSTASVIFRLGSKLYFANVGDSLSFLAKYNSSSAETTIVHRNRFDKPHLPEEKERIERMGGKVFIPPQHPDGSRVIALNPLRSEMVSLGMSRAVGDWSHGDVGVIAEPVIDVLKLDELVYDNQGTRKHDIELFVVTSSDGLYDHKKPAFVANLLAQSFFVKGGDHPIVQCAKIIDLATPQNPQRYRDDITVMALRVVV